MEEISEFIKESCPHYEEEHDMGATIPLCRKDGSICDGCKKDNFIAPRGMSRSDAVLLLFLLACAENTSDPELLTDPPKPCKPYKDDEWDT